MKIVAISDTHGQEEKIDIPECDLLIHAGDSDIQFENHFETVLCWMREQSAKHIVFIGGNHDDYLSEQGEININARLPKNIHYLYNSSVNIEGLKIWGSPYSLLFNNWVFMKSEKDLYEIYKNIPDDVNIIVSHAPPYTILDKTEKGDNAGSYSLYSKVYDINPKLHIFGHIHEGYGIKQGIITKFINASQMTSRYRLENKPIIINLEN